MYIYICIYVIAYCMYTFVQMVKSYIYYIHILIHWPCIFNMPYCARSFSVCLSLYLTLSLSFSPPLSPSLSLCLLAHVYTQMYIYIYTHFYVCNTRLFVYSYVSGEKEREGEREIYIYIGSRLKTRVVQGRAKERRGHETRKG